PRQTAVCLCSRAMVNWKTRLDMARAGTDFEGIMGSAAVHIHIDGAARGNPGPAAFAFVINKDGKVVDGDKGWLGGKTNNVAEYTALIRALERAAKLGEPRLVIYSDSELLVKQMKGIYQVKNKDLQALYEQAKELCDRFESVTLHHVRREQNSHAD